MLRLTEIQLDALTEVANIGSSHAATSLSELLSRKIMIRVPQLLIGTLNDILAEMFDRDSMVTTVTLNYVGDISGRTIVIYPYDDAQYLIKILIDEKSESRTDIHKSLLKEVSSILFCSYMNALSDFLGFLILPSIPHIDVDVAGAALSKVLSNSSYKSEFFFCIKTEFCFSTNEKPIYAFLLFVPDKDCVALILRELDMIRKSFLETI